MRRTAAILWGVSALLVILSAAQSLLLLLDPGEGPAEPVFTVFVFGPLAVLMSLVGAALWVAGARARVGSRGPLARAAVWLWALAAGAELAHLAFLIGAAERVAMVLALWGVAMWFLDRVDRRVPWRPGGRPVR